MTHSIPLPSEHISIESVFFRDKFVLNHHYQKITIQGPLGCLYFNCPVDFKIFIEDSKVFIIAPNHFNFSLFNSFLSLFNNALLGVSSGFSKSLSLNGVGFKASLSKPRELSLSIGFCHPIYIEVPSYISSISCPDPSTILASSFSLPLLSNFLHQIRLIRPSSKDPYKAKGLSIL